MEPMDSQQGKMRQHVVFLQNKKNLLNPCKQTK